MKPVTIYTTPICGYCRAAKHLLGSKGVTYEEIDVMADPTRRDEMTKRANGRRTVPQVFVGETHVGGFDDLTTLERQGRLDALLAD